VEAGSIEVRPEQCAECLSCQLICSLTHTNSFNPLKAKILIDWTGRRPEKISFADDCLDCGVCADYCAYGALRRKGESE
jgi:Fe-S-cluster-containing hydrogenase component 2